jgi:hypothetical protein
MMLAVDKVVVYMSMDAVYHIKNTVLYGCDNISI